MKKSKREVRKGDWTAAALVRRMAKDNDCPFYDGVGEIPESDSPYVIILDADRKLALRVRRKSVEGGIPEDPGALIDEGLFGDLDDIEEWDDSAAEDEEEAVGDIRPFDPLSEDVILDIFSLGSKHEPASGSMEDRQLPTRNDPPHDGAPKE
jgi:hypothetical protein